MTFLGVDQSLNATGLCLLDDRDNVLVLVTLDPDKRRDAERLYFVRREIMDVLGEFSTPVQAALEGYSFGSTSQHFSLGEVCGVVRLTLFERKVPFEVVPPSSLKLYGASIGHATKDQMIAAAQAMGASPADDNQADAFFLASIARHLHVPPPQTTRARIEVIHRLKNPKVKTVSRPRKLVKHAI